MKIIILVLMKNGTESYGKNLICWKILIRSIIVQDVMIFVLMNMVLNVEHCQDFGKIMVGLLTQQINA